MKLLSTLRNVVVRRRLTPSQYWVNPAGADILDGIESFWKFLLFAKGSCFLKRDQERVDMEVLESHVHLDGCCNTDVSMLHTELPVFGLRHVFRSLIGRFID